MSNSYYVAPDFTVTNALIATVGTVVDDIHDTDLPDLHVDIANAAAQIFNIYTWVPTVKTDTENILAKGRGETKRAVFTNGNENFQIVLEIASGKGKLLYAYLDLDTENANQAFMKITMDGTLNDLPFAGILKDTEYALCYQDRTTAGLFGHDTNLEANVRMLNYEFKTSLKIELRRPNNAPSDTNMTLFYIEE